MHLYIAGIIFSMLFTYRRLSSHDKQLIIGITM